jgi:hypothetical protein
MGLLSRDRGLGDAQHERHSHEQSHEPAAGG